MIIKEDFQEGPFKQHLITILEPILLVYTFFKNCDADPETLADYVIALLTHTNQDISNKDLMNLCISQLEEFLKGETEDFVKQVFNILETKSYLPGYSGKIQEEKSSDLKRSHDDVQEQKEDSDQSDDDQNFKHKRTSRESRSPSLQSKSSDIDEQSQPPNKKYRTDNKSNKSSSNNQYDNKNQNKTNSFSNNNSNSNINNNNNLGKRRRNENDSDNSKGNGKYMRSNDSNEDGKNNFKNNYHQNQQNQINNNKHMNSKKTYQNMNQDFSYLNNNNMNNNNGNNGNNNNMWFNQNNQNMQVMQNNQNRFRGRNQQQFRNQTNNGMHPIQRCIDYDEKGYCLRGDMCPYDHGMDRIVVDEMASSNRRNFDNMMNNNIPPRMMPSMNQNNFNNQYMNGNNVFENDNSYLNTEGYDPERPSYNSNVGPSQWGNEQMDNSFQNNNMSNQNRMEDQLQSNQSNNNDIVKNNNNNNPQNTSGRGRSGRGRGRGRGGFGFNRHRQSAKQSILNIENIPPEYFAIDKINNYFKKFGTILNINLSPRHYKATIQFSQYNEANQAYNSPDPIFGNRFVKLYWAKTESEENDNSIQNEAEGIESPQSKNKSLEEEKPALSSEEMEQINIMKKSMISRHLEKQKAFMKQVENPNLTKPEKEEILNNIRLITESVKHIMNASPQNIKILAGNILQQPKETETNKPVEEKAVENTKLTAEEQLLKEKVESLKTEAANLGIDASAITAAAATSASVPSLRGRGGFRARGRGIHSWGRGGRSFRLDNRPTKLLIKGFSKDQQTQIKQHFELFGIVENFLVSKDNQSAIVHYQTRPQAEQAYIYGKKVEGINETLELSWFTETPDPKLYDIPATTVSGTSSAVAETLAQLANKINKINGSDNKAVVNLSSTLESLKAETKPTEEESKPESSI
ncbi:hypothetical protein BCR36DRAFT_140217 [Piromyces finnis]|uniref:C3H1-type domain-containing protein n=1 Tax=Piromyces finnis TaxID=1754191 RepID=A0A1Y1UYW9_9FUNG|nr:hypothetical protein BCR36DRAFT_140217 [Piromyces finnis]|eukprot:ORX43763.1 hypothetical protein BCR36DRAFT_140217 [Piromyces finnis]